MEGIYLRFPNGRKKVFTLSFDDNVTQDEKLIRLMKKYNIKGTFNIIPGWFSEDENRISEDEIYKNITEKKALEIYDNALVEVANHSWNHSKLTELSHTLLVEDILQCKKKLESIFRKPIFGLAYPYGGV